MSDNPLLESDEAILRRQLKAMFRQEFIAPVMLTQVFGACVRPEFFVKGGEAAWKWIGAFTSLYGISLESLGLKYISRDDWIVVVTVRPCYRVMSRERLVAKALELFKPEYADILELEFGAASLVKSGI